MIIMTLCCISWPEALLVFALAIPVIAIIVRSLIRIPIDRLLVSKHFTSFMLIYVALALIAIFIPAFIGAEPHASEVTKSCACGSAKNHAWNHFFAPGTTINGNANVLYYCLIDVLGVFVLNILIITTIINSLSRHRENWKSGKISYNRSLYGFLCKKNVVVVLGNHESIFEVVRQCLVREGKRKPNYVLVLIDGDIDEYRSKMMSVIPKKDMKKVVFRRGNFTSGLDLMDIHIEKASEVFILGNKINQDGGMSLHDAECIKCIRLIRDNGNNGKGIVTASSRKKVEPLTCRVFFEYQTSYSVFQTADIGGNETRPIDGNPKNRMRVLVFKPLNFYEHSCEKVIACPNHINSYYIPIDGQDGIQEKSDEFVHLIIVGQTQMGTALGIETAHLAHFPNFHKMENGKRVGPRTRITFIDENADTEKMYFMGRMKELFELSPWKYRDMSVNYDDTKWIYPMDNESSPYYDGHIGKDFIDVEWEFIKGNIASAPIREYLTESIHDRNAKCTIAICFHDQNLSVAAAQYLPDEVCRKSQEILVYQNREESVIDEMNKYDLTDRFSKFRSFGTISKFYDDKLCQETESHFDKTLMIFDPKKPKSKSQIACWWSDRYRELTTWIRLRSFGTNYDDVNLELFSKVEHTRWNMEQLLLGFRPLTKDEQERICVASGDTRKTEKDTLKSQKAHFDICSCEKLQKIDKDVIEYDMPQYQYELKRIWKIK